MTKHISTLEYIKSRGLLHDASNLETLAETLSAKNPLTFYCGFDPTSDSLHVGSLLPLMLMRYLKSQGHHAIAVIGTSTGMIGDPSGKSNERSLLELEVVKQNADSIAAQISGVLSAPDAHTATGSLEILQNHTWLESLTTIEFLRTVGKHFSVNSMIAKDSVRSRLENREQGISYTEFSYMLLQAYDFYWLNEHKSCTLQIGGSDQWGNITEGIELIRRLSSKKANTVFGLTVPLLTTKSGQKFGKTEEGAVWLSADKTSPFKFYQYWVNTADEDVINLLKLFTELPLEKITELEKQTELSPEKRLAQKALAFEVTTLIHGKEAAKNAVDATNVLFGQPLDGISANTLKSIFADVSSLGIKPAKLKEGLSLTELIVLAKLTPSKGAARRLIQGGGVYLNNKKNTEAGLQLQLSDFVDKQVLVLRSGKKKYCLVTLED